MPRTKNKQESVNLYTLPAKVLFFVGLVDILRGVLHTFAVKWAAQTFAQLDLSVLANDQLTLLGAFGMSNFLTGFIYLLISRRAKELSPFVLIIIPLAYLTGIIGLRLNGIRGESAFAGQYFMLLYFGICILTFGVFLYKKSRL